MSSIVNIFCLIYNFTWVTWTHTTVILKMHFPIVFWLIISILKCCILVLSVWVPLGPLGPLDPQDQAGLWNPYPLCPPDKITQNIFEIFAMCFNVSAKMNEKMRKQKKVALLPSLQVNPDQEPRQVPLALVSQHLPATRTCNNKTVKTNSCREKDQQVGGLTFCPGSPSSPGWPGIPGKPSAPLSPCRDNDKAEHEWVTSAFLCLFSLKKADWSGHLKKSKVDKQWIKQRDFRF